MGQPVFRPGFKHNPKHPGFQLLPDITKSVRRFHFPSFGKFLPLVNQ